MLAAFASFALALPAGTPQLAIDLKVMTYNIRYGTAADGKDSWPNRREALLKLIKDRKPHVLGVQEALHDQIEFLAKELPGYGMYGVGRDDGKTKGEYSAVFYDKSLFDLGSGRTQWISETPDIPGSRGFGATLPRIITVVTIKGKRVPSFLIVNTHFDHQSAAARLAGAKMIAEVVNSEKDLPIVVMGDFNSSESEAPVSYLVEQTGLKHVRPMVPPYGTFSAFKLGETGGAMIDHIFASSQAARDGSRTARYFHSVKSEIDRTTYKLNGEERYPSDHFPVFATLTIAF